MRGDLGRSISSLNLNKLNGLLAGIEFRHSLQGLGFGGKVSHGGWIARRKGPGEFGRNTVALFPEVMAADTDYPPDRPLPQPSLGLHTVASKLHESGIVPYFCAAVIGEE